MNCNSVVVKTSCNYLRTELGVSWPWWSAASFSPSPLFETKGDHILPLGRASGQHKKKCRKSEETNQSHQRGWTVSARVWSNWRHIESKCGRVERGICVPDHADGKNEDKHKWRQAQMKTSINEMKGSIEDLQVGLGLQGFTDRSSFVVLLPFTGMCMLM